MGAPTDKTANQVKSTSVAITFQQTWNGAGWVMDLDSINAQLAYDLTEDDVVSAGKSSIRIPAADMQPNNLTDIQNLVLDFEETAAL